MDSQKNNVVSAASGLENILLQEKTSQINKNTSERLIFAKGILAKGRFTVNQSLSGYTSASLLNGGKCEVLVRFSSIMNEDNKPSLGVKGMSIKFITENGEWDLVCSNVPVFAFQDGKKFPDYLKALKNQDDTTAEWEFYGQNPETLHHLLIAKSARGLPVSYANMHAYSGNTYSLIAANGTKYWVKFHFKTEQGIENLSSSEVEKLQQEDYYNQKLITDFNSGQKPKWKVLAQILSEEQAKEMAYNPFDATKVWLHEASPLIEIGEIALDEILAETENENIIFTPSNVIEGIGFSPDRLLLSRLAIYGNAQRKRLGENYPEKKDFSAFENAVKSLEGTDAEYGHYETSDPYLQAGLFYSKALKNDDERLLLAENIIISMKKIRSEKREEIINRQLCHFFRANVELGIKIAMGLQINIDMSMMSHAKNM